MDGRSKTHRTRFCNTHQKELAALLATRGRDGLGCKFSELRTVCGNAAAVYRAIADLTARGFRIGRKKHADGTDFFFAVEDNGLRFPTHFTNDEPEQFYRPLLAARPARASEEWPQ